METQVITKDPEAYYREECISLKEFRAIIDSGKIGTTVKIVSAERKKNGRLLVKISRGEELLEMHVLSHVYNGKLVLNRKSVEFFLDKYEEADVSDLFE